MKIIETSIKGLVELQPRLFSDDRGYFFESFNEKTFESMGLAHHFVQDNQSFSKKGVLRGLHLQLPPYAQGKLVRVISGKAYDIAVDLRPESETYGQSYGCMLDGELQNMFYIPEGFAHGFVALEDTVFFYKCTNIYHQGSEAGIIWNDEELNIDWGIQQPLLSEKDLELPTLKVFEKDIAVEK